MMHTSSPGSEESKKNQTWQLYIKAERLMKGNAEEAKIYLDQAREMNTELGDPLLNALIVESLASYYEQSDKYENALKMANDAIVMFKQLSNSGPIAQLGNANGLISLGNTYTKLGKYKVAIVKPEKAVEILLKLGKTGKVHLGIAFGNMGYAYNLLKEYNKAIELFEEAFKISQMTGYKLEEARSLHNIGAAYYQMGKFQKSVEYCVKSARIFTEIGSKKGVSLSYGVLASSYDQLGHLNISERYHNICIEINHDMKQLSDLAIAYGNKGLFYYKISLAKFLNFSDANESLEKCIEAFKLAIQATDEILASLALDSNKTAFSDKFYRWYDCLTGPFNLLGRSTAALLFLNLGRAKILRHLVYRQVKDKEQDEGQSSFESSWLTIENREEKKRICVLSKDIQLLETNATVLFYNFNDAEILTIWESKSSTSRQELEDNIKKLLEKASVGLPRSYSFFKPSTAFHFENPNAQQLSSENAAEATNDNDVEDKDSRNNYRSPAKKSDTLCDLTKDTRSFLHRVLIDPVKSLIKETKLIIVPQSCIFFAPFSAFIDESGCLLSEKYQIQVISSIHALALSILASRSKKIGGSLFVGNPEVQLPSLLFAEEEVEYISSLLNAKPLTGRMATKSKVIDLMSNASIIHIAAHGQE
ncbi:tetratricopeptide repeat 28-like [Paramuricea clavata]|uniref:Tetratricopeptide repeat 28-like n=1 Tax=Paramuricea clavata TaxID=317549 RepID=A0A7D9ENI7_PARCT|nr:tetratricopeptide repeat 28-like [Paramuricea clavata]